MNKETLTQMVTLAGEQAHRVMIGLGDQLMTTWVLVGADGGMSIIATPWKDDLEKEIMTRQVRLEIRKKKAVAYSFVTEAWAALAPKGWKPGDPHIPSSQHPERQEVVIAFATDGKEIAWRKWRTVRDWTEKVVKLDPQPFPDGGVESWMTELLKP